MGKINFKPLFIIYVFLCIYFEWFNDIFYYIVAVVLHEYGHMLVAKFLGYNCYGITFDLYGAEVHSNNNFKRKDDIVISLAGPIVNVLLIMLTVCLWWLFPSTYNFTHSFLTCNIFVMLFNLLPIYPLDGGRIIIAILNKKIKKSKLLKISSYICIVAGILFFSLFIVSIFYIVNFNFLFIGMFLFVNGVICVRNYKFININNIICKKNDVNEIKLWKVNSLEYKDVFKFISRDYYSIFICKTNGKQIIKSEDDFYNL